MRPEGLGQWSLGSGTKPKPVVSQQAQQREECSVQASSSECNIVPASLVSPEPPPARQSEDRGEEQCRTSQQAQQREESRVQASSTKKKKFEPKERITFEGLDIWEKVKAGIALDPPRKSKYSPKHEYM